MIPLKSVSDEDPKLLPELIAVFATRTREEWTELNERENVAITPVLSSIQEIENDPQMKHRGLIVELDYEPLGKVKQIKMPFLMSKTPTGVHWIPRYGQHTDEILTAAGFTPDEIAVLRADGAI